MDFSGVKGNRIAIELLNGTKLFGIIHNWDKKYIWIILDGEENPIDVPKDIIMRSLVLFDGGIDG